MEELNNTIEEQEQDQNNIDNDGLKDAIMARMQQIYNDGMIVGFQTACNNALSKIYSFESSCGKKSANDYKRCIKDLKKFFETGISRNVNSNKEESTDEETVQN